MNEEAELDETNASLLTVPLGFTQLPLIDQVHRKHYTAHNEQPQTDIIQLVQYVLHSVTH